jgi:dolichyl-phosphate-mannose--protein O-mannosyl transferase
MKKTSGFAVASLVLGILALGILAIRNSLFLSSFLVLILVFIIAVSATIFGAIAIHQTGNNSNRRGRDLAIAGLCLGIIVIVLGVVFIVGLNLTL